MMEMMKQCTSCNEPLVSGPSPFCFISFIFLDLEDMRCKLIPVGGGTILGGSYEKGRWESQPDPNLAQRIMKRCVELVPELTNGKGVEALSIVRHGVGLRPHRIGGVRLEKEEINYVWVVHNYGHGGFGCESGTFVVSS
jgi:D-amino-acid oxidase